MSTESGMLFDSVGNSSDGVSTPMVPLVATTSEHPPLLHMEPSNTTLAPVVSQSKINYLLVTSILLFLVLVLCFVYMSKLYYCLRQVQWRSLSRERSGTDPSSLEPRVARYAVIYRKDSQPESRPAPKST